MPPKAKSEAKSQAKSEAGSATYTSKKGRQSSFADAKHDFHDIFDSKTTKQYVSKNIPPCKKNDRECEEDDKKTLDEDTFLETYVLKGKDGMAKFKEAINKVPKLSERIFEPEANTFNKEITDDYQIRFVYRPQHETGTSESFIQKALNDMGVIDDVFIVCDVAYANVREDLTNTNKRGSQTFYWVQNTQTLYDPAGKTSWHTGKDYGFQDIDSKFVFCWENANLKTFTKYPDWTNSTKDTNNEYMFSEKVPETMLYTNKNMYMGIQVNAADVNDYREHDAVLIITDPTKPRYYAYADKVLSAKGNGILNKSEMANYRAKGDDLRRYVKFLKTKETVLLDEVMDYSSETQVLAKKTGDAGQSIVCCQEIFHLQRFKDVVKGFKDAVINFQSNGNHSFFSFDRIAIGCALNYKAPIVVQNTQNGFIIYVHNKLANVNTQLDKLLVKENNQLNLSEPFFGSFDEKINECIKLKDSIIAYLLELKISDDESYKAYLRNYYLYLPILQLINSISLYLEENNKSYYDNCKKQIIANYNLLNDNKTTTTTTIPEDTLVNIIKKFEDDINKEFDRLIAERITNKENDEKLKEIAIAAKKIKELYSIIPQIKNTIQSTSSITEQINTKNEANKIIKLDVKQIDKNVPKGIRDNISNVIPFQSAITPLKESRNADAFIDRATQYLGITTLIVPIYQNLNNNILRVLKNDFVGNVKQMIVDIQEKSSNNNNLSYSKIVQIANEQLEQNGVLLNDIILSDPITEKIEIENKILNNELKKITDFETATKATKAATTKEAEDKITKDLAEARAKIQQKIQIIEVRRSLRIANKGGGGQNGGSQEYDTVAMLTKMKLLVSPVKVASFLYTDSFINDFFLDTTKSFENRKRSLEILNENMKHTQTENTFLLEKDIASAYEIEMFLKGLFGIFTFMKNVDKTTPIVLPPIFGPAQTANQLIDVFLETTEQLLFPTEVDPEVSLGIQNDDNEFISIIKKRIIFKQQHSKTKPFNLDDIIENYNKLSKTGNDDDFIITKFAFLESNFNMFKKKRSIGLPNPVNNNITIAKEGDNILFMKNYVYAFEEFKDEYENDIYIPNNSFKTLIENNSLSFPDKPLTGKYDGFNASEFNFNMALLYYIENEKYKKYVDNENMSSSIPSTINSLYSDIEDLFEQLFGSVQSATTTTTTTLLPGGKKTGGTQDIFKGILNGLGVDLKNPVFKPEKVQQCKEVLHFHLNGLNKINIDFAVNPESNMVAETQVVKNPREEKLQKERDEYDRLYREKLLKLHNNNNTNMITQKIEPPYIEYRIPSENRSLIQQTAGNNLQKTRRKNGLNSHSSKPFLRFTSKTKYNQQKRISRNKKTNHIKKNETHKKK